MKIYHVPDGSGIQRGTEHGNIVLDTLVNPRLIVLENHANLIRPVVDRFLVVDLFTKSAYERPWGPYLTRFLLFLEHRIQDRHKPVFKLAVVVVRYHKIPNAIHAPFT